MLEGDRWRLLDTGCADGATNMAIDEAILLACSRGQAPPTLRLYGWEPACLSIGYFQATSREINLEECARQGISCVRRLTGGRAVLHDRELTYSVVLPASHPLAAGEIAHSYRRLGGGLLAGLIELGLPIQSGPWESPAPGAEGRPPALGRSTDRTAACFDTAAGFEPRVHGRKLVGSAQTRKRGAVLQHGTILIDFEATRLAALLTTDAAVSDRLADLLRGRVISLREALGREVSYDEVARSITAGFARALGLSLEPGTLTPIEAQTSADLAYTRYRNPDWNLKR